jgi:hypothetical protein
MFGIFQSTTLAHILHRYGRLMTPDARKVAVWHTEQVFKTYRGAAQPDFKFHGANDNMPMMAASALILGGETLGNMSAVEHGTWHLNQFRRQLSRAAWASEFNSSTYSALTLSTVAKVASFSKDAQIRELAMQIEKRLWAEILLHYHPGTLRQAGPQCRAYCIDYAGHNHSLQVVMWYAFGDITGRDIIGSYFNPDGIEVLHFAGFPMQSVSEYADMLDTDLHVPDDIAHLIINRKYPAFLSGRAECMGFFDDGSGQYRTSTWMQEKYSLGTCNIPLCGGEQSANLYATYALESKVKNYKESASVFFKYFTSSLVMGDMETHTEGKYKGEKYIPSQGWCYALQNENTAVLLATPNLKKVPLVTDTLKLSVIFPCHYSGIRNSIIGNCGVKSGAAGKSDEVVPVSVETGEVFIHIYPLMPVKLQRKSAIRFNKNNHYEMLELVNYEGEKCVFEREELSRVHNGFVLTIESKDCYGSLQEFHDKFSKVKITDYVFFNHRYWLYQREDLEMEVVLSSHPVFGVQTECINGRHVPNPIFESNQIDVDKLPFMTGPVERNPSFFPWKTLKANPWPDKYWAIGSRGVEQDGNYSNMINALCPEIRLEESSVAE